MTDLLTPKQRSAFNRALKHRELLPLLYSKVKNLVWFDVFKEEGLLRPEENPTPESSEDGRSISIQYWHILEFLVNSSEKLTENENAEYADKYLQLIRDVTSYAIDNDYGNYRTWWQFAKILRNIPIELIQQEDSKYLEYWLDDKYESGLVAEELGALLVNQLNVSSAHSLNLAEDLLKILYKIHFEERKLGSSLSKDAFFNFDIWYSQKLTEKCANLVGEKLRWRGLDVFDSNLKSIVKELDNDSWSAIWQPAIEDHEQNQYKDDAENILVKGYREAILKFIDTNAEQALIYLNKMFNSDYVIIRRIAIYAANINLQVFNEFTDKILEKKYFSSEYRHEVWWFLKNNYTSFLDKNKIKVLEIIDSIELLDDGAVNVRATAYEKAIWLSSIKEVSDVEFANYKKNTGIAGAEPEHPDFSSYMSFGWNGHESPIPLDELGKLPINDLVNTLASYKDTGGLMEPGIKGLTKTFKQLIKTDPKKFFPRLGEFLELDLAYIYEVVEANRDLWLEKAQLPWDEIWPALLNFCSLLIQQKRFWSNENERQREHFVANRYWIVGAIGRLIEDGTKSDEHAFDEKYLKNAEDVLSVLLDREKGVDYNNDTDAVSKSINSPRGHCIEALINLTLRFCRIADKKNHRDHSRVWSRFQSYYDSELSRADTKPPEYEFATLVTNYLPNFLYMSKTWVLNNLGRIFDQNNYLKWLCAMQGYAYVGTVYQEIYKFLKEHGDILKSLDDENIKDEVEKKIIQNIAVAFINDFESFNEENSLIQIFITRNEQREISQFIWFIWTLRKKGDQNLKNKVYELWPKILRNTDLTTDEGKRMASKLCHWTVFVDNVDDESRYLINAVAPYADVSHNSHDLLRSIAAISETQPFEAYGIMMKMFEGAFPYYPEEAIKKILANLIKQKQEGKQKAKDIVDIYLKQGIRMPYNILNEIMGVEQRV